MNKKLVLWGILFALVVGGGYFGWQYYLDNVKPPEISPAKVVEQYFAAVQKKDYNAAYAMVSKAHYFDSYNQFIDRVVMYSPDMTLEVKEEKITEGKATVEIRISVPLKFGLYASDSQMDLVRAKRVWQIVHP